MADTDPLQPPPPLPPPPLHLPRDIPPPHSDSGDVLSTGPLVAIITGGGGVLLVIVTLLVVWLLKRKRTSSEAAVQERKEAETSARRQKRLTKRRPISDLDAAEDDEKKRRSRRISLPPVLPPIGGGLRKSLSVFSPSEVMISSPGRGSLSRSGTRSGGGSGQNSPRGHKKSGNCIDEDSLHGPTCSVRRGKWKRSSRDSWPSSVGATPTLPRVVGQNAVGGVSDQHMRDLRNNFYYHSNGQIRAGHGGLPTNMNMMGMGGGLALNGGETRMGMGVPQRGSPQRPQLLRQIPMNTPQGQIAPGMFAYHMMGGMNMNNMNMNGMGNMAGFNGMGGMAMSGMGNMGNMGNMNGMAMGGGMVGGGPHMQALRVPPRARIRQSSTDSDLNDILRSTAQRLQLDPRSSRRQTLSAHCSPNRNPNGSARYALSSSSYRCQSLSPQKSQSRTPSPAKSSISTLSPSIYGGTPSPTKLALPPAPASTPIYESEQVQGYGYHRRSLSQPSLVSEDSMVLSNIPQALSQPELATVLSSPGSMGSMNGAPNRSNPNPTTRRWEDKCSPSASSGVSSTLSTLYSEDEEDDTSGKGSVRRYVVSRLAVRNPDGDPFVGPPRDESPIWESDISNPPIRKRMGQVGMSPSESGRMSPLRQISGNAQSDTPTRESREPRDLQRSSAIRSANHQQPPPIPQHARRRNPLHNKPVLCVTAPSNDSTPNSTPPAFTYPDDTPRELRTYGSSPTLGGWETRGEEGPDMTNITISYSPSHSDKSFMTPQTSDMRYSLDMTSSPESICGGGPDSWLDGSGNSTPTPTPSEPRVKTYSNSPLRVVSTISNGSSTYDERSNEDGSKTDEKSGETWSSSSGGTCTKEGTPTSRLELAIADLRRMNSQIQGRQVQRYAVCQDSQEK